MGEIGPDGTAPKKFILGQTIPHLYIDCGLIGYDVLNNIPHYKPCRVPYVFLRDDVFKQIQQLQDVA